MANARGYWIARVEVRDHERWQEYVTRSHAAFTKFGARFLARGGRHEVLEGEGRPRNVVIEFPSLDAARDCHNSPEYSDAAKCRKGAGDIDVIIVEGIEG